MGYRSGTYIAFDGLGETDPTKSDFRFYATIQSWAASKHIEFKFVNSHDKTRAVRDTSLRTTLEARIRERLSHSKNVVVILSDRTRKSGSMLSYEIEQAVDRYKLPLIAVYTGYERVLQPSAPEQKLRWPKVLDERINDDSAKVIHIPFKKAALLDAIGQFTVHANNLSGALVHYTEKKHREWGYY